MICVDFVIFQVITGILRAQSACKTYNYSFLQCKRYLWYYRERTLTVLIITLWIVSVSYLRELHVGNNFLWKVLAEILVKVIGLGPLRCLSTWMVTAEWTEKLRLLTRSIHHFFVEMYYFYLTIFHVNKWSLCMSWQKVDSPLGCTLTLEVLQV